MAVVCAHQRRLCCGWANQHRPSCSGPPVLACAAQPRRRLFAIDDDDTAPDAAAPDEPTSSSDSETTNSQWWRSSTRGSIRRAWHKPQGPTASRTRSSSNHIPAGNSSGQGTAAGSDTDGRPRPSVKYTGSLEADQNTGLKAVAYQVAGATFSPQCKIHVFYDLDNLMPREVVPEELVEAIKSLVGQFGTIASLTTYGNEATFMSVPPIAVASKRLAQQLQRQEQALATAGKKPPPSDAYRCEFCGKRCRTAQDLSKHFEQLHTRELRKKMSHKPLAKKLRANKAYMERYTSARDAARGVGITQLHLEQRLQAMGVQTRRVPVKPQAVDECIISDVHQLLRTANLDPGSKQRAGSQSEAASSISPDDDGSISRRRSSSSTRQPAPFQHAICIISDDRDFEGALEAAQRRGWGCLMVCSAHVTVDRDQGTGGFRRRRREVDKHNPGRRAVEGVAEQMVSTGSGLKDVQRLLQAGPAVGSGGVWDLAAVQLALARGGGVRMPMKACPQYPGAHVTLDFHAACALAVQASQDAVQAQRQGQEAAVPAAKGSGADGGGTGGGTAAPRKRGSAAAASGGHNPGAQSGETSKVVEETAAAAAAPPPAHKRGFADADASAALASGRSASAAALVSERGRGRAYKELTFDSVEEMSQWLEKQEELGRRPLGDTYCPFPWPYADGKEHWEDPDWFYLNFIKSWDDFDVDVGEGSTRRAKKGSGEGGKGKQGKKQGSKQGSKAASAPKQKQKKSN